MDEEQLKQELEEMKKQNALLKEEKEQLQTALTKKKEEVKEEPKGFLEGAEYDY
jgi:regulator of replication initiation timing